MALFAPVRQQQSNNLIEFRAGKMDMRQNNMVHPDKRKGQVFLYQSEDSLMHFCWKDRTTGAVEDDLIIFPDDAEFVQVKQCTTGRAFLLKLKPANRKYFFWMQEPKVEKDEEIMKKVNDLLNHPPAPGSSRGNRAGAAGASGAGALGGMMGIPEDELTPEQMSELQNVLGGLGIGGGRNLDQAQLMQLMQMMGAGGGYSGMGFEQPPGNWGGSGAAPARASGAAAETPVIPEGIGARPAGQRQSQAAGAQGQGQGAARSAGGVQLSDLQSILSNMNVPTAPQVNEPDIQSFAEMLQQSEGGTTGDGSKESGASKSGDGDTSASGDQAKGSSTSTKGKEKDEAKEPPSKKDKPDDDMELD